MKKEWKRNCPECNKELIYYSNQNLWRANRDRCLCASCAKTGDKNPAKQDWVRKKIGESGTEYHLPDQIELTCLCGNKWNIGKRNYIFYYLRPNKQPRCSFCVNQEIADNITPTQKKIRSKKMSKIMMGRKITWSDNLVKSHWTKNPDKNDIIREKISQTKSILISEGKIKFNTGYKSGYYTSDKTGRHIIHHNESYFNYIQLNSCIFPDMLICKYWPMQFQGLSIG